MDTLDICSSKHSHVRVEEEYIIYSSMRARVRIEQDVGVQCVQCGKSATCSKLVPAFSHACIILIYLRF